MDEKEKKKMKDAIKKGKGTRAKIDDRLKYLYMIQELSKAIDLEVRPT